MYGQCLTTKFSILYLGYVLLPNNIILPILIGERSFRVGGSVTRFGEIWPLWQNIKSLCPFIDVNYGFTYFYHIWQIVVVNGQILNE